MSQTKRSKGDLESQRANETIDEKLTEPKLLNMTQQNVVNTLYTGGQPSSRIDGSDMLGQEEKRMAMPTDANRGSNAESVTSYAEIVNNSSRAPIKKMDETLGHASNETRVSNK